jgi:hypothetical protein
MTSSVSICSNALLLIGDKPISSLDEANDRARLASNLYAEARDAVLRMHPWNCAKKRVMLAPLATAPAFDYSYQFQLPADFMRPIQVGLRNDPIGYLIEGQTLLCNVDTVPLVYVFRNTNESTWDGLFVEAMTLMMASRFAWPITKSATLAQTKLGELQALLKTARAVNGQDDPPETLGDFPLLSERLTGYGSTLGVRTYAPGR